MKSSFLSLSLALALSAGLAASALANETGSASSSMPTQVAAAPASSDNLAHQREMSGAAVDAYNANINPLATVKLVGPYDQADAFTGPNGFPLPGWYSMKGDVGSGGGGE